MQHEKALVTDFFIPGSKAQIKILKELKDELSAKDICYCE
jgi:hypothetical protein